jgi:hypothetical protein
VIPNTEHYDVLREEDDENETEHCAQTDL